MDSSGVATLLLKTRFRGAIAGLSQFQPGLGHVEPAQALALVARDRCHLLAVGRIGQIKVSSVHRGHPLSSLGNSKTPEKTLGNPQDETCERERRSKFYENAPIWPKVIRVR